MATSTAAHHASDTESTGPESPQSDTDMNWNDAVNEDGGQDHTEATFAHIDPSTGLTTEEKEKWKRSGHKPGNYICPECGKGLSRIDSLTRHRRSRHRVGRQYFCRHPGCRRQTWGFGRFDNYRRHMESSHAITIEPNDMEERQRAVREAPINESLKSPRVVKLSVAAQSSKAEKRGSYICIPVPIQQQQRRRQEQHGVDSSRAFQKPAAVPQHHTTNAPPSSAFFGSLRPVVEDVESLDKDELIRRLRTKTRECDELQQRNRVLTLERDEYLEALKISEGLRGV
ncbi:hypothetical protein TruAng_007439 [Truncatella angustata]|nr:hypothetical protein TruAng_007439 [Truncatella angustata]